MDVPGLDVELVLELDGTDDDLMAQVVAIKAVKDAIKEYEGLLADSLYERVGHGDFDSPTGRVKVNRPKRRTKWKKQELVSAIRSDKVVVADPDTGEILSEADKLFHPTLGAFNPPAPRTSVLRDVMDLDPDEYCESMPGSPTVSVL